MINQIKKVYTLYLKIRNNLWVKAEKKKGIDFTEELSLEQLGLSDDNSNYYQTAGSLRVKKILSTLNITKNDSIIDFGSGKGKIIYMMSKNFPFKKVDGVEISKTLCDIAIKNLEILDVKNSTIFNQDALEFTDIDDYNFIYFYNPFPPKVMKGVMENIEKSLIKLPRNLTIVYFNPTCHSEIIASGIFNLVKSKWRVSVYKNI